MKVDVYNKELVALGSGTTLFRHALGLLETKPLPAQMSMGLADFVVEVEAAVKKYNRAVINTWLAHGAEKTRTGARFSEAVPMPPECLDECVALGKQVVQIEIKQQYTLPETTASGKPIDYEAIIYRLRGTFLKGERPPRGEDADAPEIVPHE